MNPDSESRLDRMERMIEAMRARRAEYEERQRKLAAPRAQPAADAAKAELRYKSDMAWIRRVTRIAEKVLGEETNGNV